MAIVTRSGKGSALTHTEMDANLNEISLKANTTDVAISISQIENRIEAVEMAQETNILADIELGIALL
jgi:hypothetical protein